MDTPDVGPNISMREARQRLRDEKCLNCGQDATNRELNSCNNPKCVKVLRPLYHWAKRVVNHALRDDETTYITFAG